MRKDILSFEETRFYIAETVLAMESLHRHSYIHRRAQLLYRSLGRPLGGATCGGMGSWEALSGVPGLHAEPEDGTCC